MSVVRVGTNKKYSENWDSIFARGKKKAAKPAASMKKSVAKKTAAKGKKKR